MNIFRRIFGSPEDVSKIVDAATAGADKLFFTNEEKADANQKILEFRLDWLKATAGQNLARRFIALLVAGLWTFLVLLGVAVRHLSETYSDFIFQILQDVVMQPFSIILAFYFITQTVREYRKGN